MNKILYTISIKPKPEEKVYCLGYQLQEILRALHPFLSDCIWYAADVVIYDQIQSLYDWEEFSPNKLGSTDKFIEICSKVGQFISGVFLAYRRIETPSPFIQYSFEDETFLDIDKALIVIRAFDTSSFEVSSYDIELIKILAEHYSVKVEEGEAIPNPPCTESEYFYDRSLLSKNDIESAEADRRSGGDERQLQNMLQYIEKYKNQKISLRELLGRLRVYYKALRNIDEQWKEKFFRLWKFSEATFVSAIYFTLPNIPEEKSISENDMSEIKQNLDQLEKMIREKL